MNNATIEAIQTELNKALLGQRFGKVFPLSRRSLAVDFRLPRSGYLFISAEPASPRVYLIRRRLKDLERASVNSQQFHLLLKKHLSGMELSALEKLPDERVMFLRFSGTSEIGEAMNLGMVVQLTGRSSNIFLVDERVLILGSLVEKDTDGQRMGEIYAPPARIRSFERSTETVEVDVKAEDEGSISAALDRYFSEREAEDRIRSRVDAARKSIEREIAKRRKLIGRLNDDLKNHGDAEQWKRYGDLILANLSTAKRKGGKVVVTDYFDENAGEIEIEADENRSLTDTAQKYFKRYTKAANAAGEIERRIKAAQHEIASAEGKRTELETAIEQGKDPVYPDMDKDQPRQKNKKEKTRFAGARQFISSDGYEILVGKKATDNDQLTFRVAGPVDLWLHAADYPGSHVVVRNPNREEVPQRTLLEAAQLAAFYSSGKSQPKAAVHYTKKKFVNKPRGAAPGLVRLASFKTILVEPQVPPAIDKNV